MTIARDALNSRSFSSLDWSGCLHRADWVCLGCGRPAPVFRGLGRADFLPCPVCDGYVWAALRSVEVLFPLEAPAGGVAFQVGCRALHPAIEF